MSGASSFGQLIYVVSTGLQPQTYIKIFAGLAISQVTIGIFMVILQATIIPLSFLTSYRLDGEASLGIWAGVVIVITGGVGISASKRSSRKWIKAYMILNIITVFLFVFPFIVVVSLFNVHDFDSHGGKGHDMEYWMIIAEMNVVNLIMAGAQFFITMTAAVFSCKYHCCQASVPYQPFVILGYPNNVQHTGETTQAFSQNPNQGFPQPAGQGFPQQATQLYLYSASTTQLGLTPSHVPAAATVSNVQVASNHPPYNKPQKTN